MTSNGASTRPGDLYASGTISNRDPAACGSLIELGHAFLEVGDTATIAGGGGDTVSFGEVTGTVVG